MCWSLTHIEIHDLPQKVSDPFTVTIHNMRLKAFFRHNNIISLYIKFCQHVFISWKEKKNKYTHTKLIRFLWIHPFNGRIVTSPMFSMVFVAKSDLLLKQERGKTHHPEGKEFYRSEIAKSIFQSLKPSFFHRRLDLVFMSILYIGYSGNFSQEQSEV